MRIHEAAKKYNMTNDELLTLLQRAGFEVSSHMSGMTYDMVEALERFSKPRKAKKVKAKRKTAKSRAKAAEADGDKPKIQLVRRRRPKVESPAEAEPQAAAEAAQETATADAEVAKKAAAKAAKKTTAKAAPKAKKVTVQAETAVKETADEPVEKKVAPAKRVAAKAEKTETPARKTTETPAPKIAAKPAAPAAPEADARTSARRPAKAKPAAPAPPTAKADGREAVAKRPPADEKGARRPRRQAGDAQQKAVRESVRRTLAKMETTRRTKRRKGKTRDESTTEAPPVKLSEGMTVRELADAFKLSPQDVLVKCMDLGMPLTINQSIDRDVIELLADDFGINAHFVSDEVEDLLREAAQIDPERMTPRAPIVTVMGHVDHGKTSILDYIRKTRVAAGEAGGITQHIGAYEVEVAGGKITFIDTPGHEAFTAMRARGADLTDIVVLVVAADDGVMPQTIEAVDHARAAGVPVIVAVNKIDLPAANPAQIKQRLMEHNVVVEDFGGDVVCVEVSAKTGDGIDKLLEMIALQAEMMELVADKEATGQAIAIEVKKEEGRGILCTVLVTHGTLSVGDVFVIGSTHGKVRALQDHRGKSVKQALPAMPVLILGCNDLPKAGDRLTVVQDEREARDLSGKRLEHVKDRDRRAKKKVSLEELYHQIEEGELKQLNLIVKGDTNGSVEALTESLTKLSLDEVGIHIIHSSVGVVSESDVLLASSSDALIIGFSVKVSTTAQEMAEREGVEIKIYEVIYEAISDVDDALKGLLEPERVERVLGRAEVRKVYKISRLGTIAGSFVTEGAINRNASVKIVRDGEVLHEGRVSSLKRFQDDVREVQKDFECGIGVSGFNDLMEGDIIEAFVIEEKARVI